MKVVRCAWKNSTKISVYVCCLVYTSFTGTVLILGCYFNRLAPCVSGMYLVIHVATADFILRSREGKAWSYLDSVYVNDTRLFTLHFICIILHTQLHLWESSTLEFKISEQGISCNHVWDSWFIDWHKHDVKYTGYNKSVRLSELFWVIQEIWVSVYFAFCGKTFNGTENLQ